MDIGSFYFIKDDFFIDFPDENLMKNKESIDGKLHGRPCFFAFLDEKTQLYWMIPFSSQVNKFRVIYDKKIARYGQCDTIVFGNILGYEKAFLIQNMCPTSIKYIESEYIDKKTHLPVKVIGSLEKELTEKAKKVLNINRKGHKLIFPDVEKIEKELIKKRINHFSNSPQNFS